MSIGEAGTRSEALEAVSVEARERLIEAIDLLNRAVNKGEVDRERLSAIESNTERINQEITQLLEKKERELENSEEFMKQKAELDERAREADLKLQEKVEEYNGLTGIMTRLAEEADNFRNSIFRLSTEITAGKSEISSMEMLRETLRKRQETLTRERDAGEDSNRETLDSLNGARGERDRLAEEMEAGREEALRLKQTMETRRREEKELAIQLEELKLSLGRMTARKKTIEELENNYEGYNHAVKHVMKSGLPGIHGVVAELIRVPEGYETAMETALGNSLQNIVCDDEDSARRAIVSLKENRAGRMTFLPLTSIRGRETPDAGIKNEKGVLGFGPECISCDSKYDSIISYLLGRVVLVDSMESAIRISRKYRGILVVTLDGEIINERGAITGGKFKNKTGNILDRRAEINQLGREIEDLNRKQSRALEKLEKVREEIGSLTDKASRLEESIRAGEHALLMKENEISMAENVLADLKNSGDKVNRELESISREQENSMRMIGEIRKSIAEKEAAIKEAESLCNEKLSLHEERKGEFNSLSEEITAARITVTAAQEQKSHAEEMMERINRELSDIEGDIARRRQQLESMEAEKRELTEGSTGIDGIISRQEAVKAEAEQRLEEVSGEKAALAGEISEMNAAREELNRKIQVLQDQKYDLDVRRAKNETQLESFKEKLWEDFEVSYIQAMEFKAEDFALSRAVKENRQIRNRIRELGEVNVGAIEEYQVVKERYEFLTGEREDVQKAMDDLNRIISEMDKTIKTRFRESFDRIVINFEKQFKELFGGGHAELRLSDENNPLESNIDIVAQPPGKKLQNINLLSGGEKTLTAIALMFAVLQAKPTPFCILDEVEAALDDANIDKFIHCLRKFDNVQFTLVTHQKATMEHADVLYGVTMPEKGISKVLSLSLEDDLSPYNG